MWLSSKIFLSSAIVIAVLTAVAILNLGALSRLVSVNREITTRTMPAIGLATSARDAIPRLQQLEARALVLGDGRYLTAWTGTAAQVAVSRTPRQEYKLTKSEQAWSR